MSDLEQAMRLLHALATSDLPMVAELTAEDVVVFGTDASERWETQATLLSALEEMRALGLRAEWADDVITRSGWVAGTAIYTFPDGGTLRTRATFVFAEGVLVHGHFSIPQAE